MGKAKNIIKYILRIAVLLTVFVFVFVQISYGFRPEVIWWDQEKTSFLGYRGEEKNSIDVLNLGASDILTSLIPAESYEQFGYTSYNYGVSAIRAPMFAALLEEALKTQSPKLVVIGLRPFATDLNEVVDGYFRWTSDLMPYSITRAKMIADSMPYMVDGDGNKVTDSGSLHLDIIKYHKNDFLKSSLEYYSGREIPEHIRKGYYLSTDTVEIELTDYTGVKETLAVSDMSIYGLNKLFDELKENNLKALFVLTPFHTDSERTERINYLEDMIAEAGFDCLNCNEYFEEIGLDEKTDYYNEGHTNIKGALKCTEFIGKYITEHYDIKKSSAVWNTDEWDKLKAESLSAMK